MMRAMPPITPPTIAPMSGLEVLLPALSDPVVAPGSALDEVGVEVLRGCEINAQLLGMNTVGLRCLVMRKPYPGAQHV